jgi:hypothetical protein
LLYLTSGRGGACDYLVAAHYFCREPTKACGWGIRGGCARNKYILQEVPSISVEKAFPKKSQLLATVFYAQHPIIEPAANRLLYRPAQHLVHHCSVGILHHNIYPAKKVSPL